MSITHAQGKKKKRKKERKKEKERISGEKKKIFLLEWDLLLRAHGCYSAT